MRAALRYLVILFLLTNNLWAENTGSPWYTRDKDNNITLNVELFLSSTCSHCHKADVFFKDIKPSAPWLHVNRNIINKNKQALIYFNQLLDEHHATDFAVPSLFFCNSRWIGFATNETTGRDILRALNYCKQQIEQHGQLSKANIDVLQHWSNANFYDSAMTEHPTTAKYLTSVAFIDAFSPCALFSLGGFFAILFIHKQRKKQMIAGLLFILGVGMSHSIQQVFSSTFFEMLPLMRVFAGFTGLAAIYLMWQHYQKNLASNLLCVLAWLLGVIIQTYQQTCLMNWSLIFQQWLYNQHITNFRAGLYQVIYQIMYVLPLLLVLFIYIFLIKMKWIKHWECRLQSIGLLYILAISVFLILYPWLLSSLGMSLFVWLGVTITGLFLSRFIQDDMM